MKDNNHEHQSLRPALHFTAPKNWINDPNGLSYYNGKYHLFYQYNPKGLDWGNMSWGHATSIDMVHWNHLPVALLPDQSYDIDGVFSGSGITFFDKHILYYTGVVKEEEKLRQVQCIAESSDGLIYKKSSDNPILEAGEQADPFDFRDPKVWVYEDFIYMIVGTRNEKEGQANIYRSIDGNQFVYLGKILKENTGYMWECPDLFQLNNQFLLMFSAMGVSDKKQANISYIGTLDYTYNQSESILQSYEQMDCGEDFYAPQSILDQKGRRVVIGWVRSNKPLNRHQNWTGMMSLPREVLYNGQQIRYRIINEVFAHKKQYISVYGIDEIMEKQVLLDSKKSYEICMEINPESDMEISFSDDLGLLISYSKTKKKLIVNRSLHGENNTYETPELNCLFVKIQIIIDRCVAEVFVNDGSYVITSMFDAQIDDLRINTTHKIKYLELSALGGYRNDIQSVETI